MAVRFQLLLDYPTAHNTHAAKAETMRSSSAKPNQTYLDFTNLSGIFPWKGFSRQNYDQAAHTAETKKVMTEQMIGTPALCIPALQIHQHWDAVGKAPPRISYII